MENSEKIILRALDLILKHIQTTSQVDNVLIGCRDIRDEIDEISHQLSDVIETNCSHPEGKWCSNCYELNSGNFINPHEYEFDTLQPGDFFIGGKDSLCEALMIESGFVASKWGELCEQYGHIIFYDGYLGWLEEKKVEELSKEEFLRRARNTFKSE